MDDVTKGRTLTMEEWNEITSILEKYGKKAFDASDTDIPFDEAVRVEMIFTNCHIALAKYYVAMARGEFADDGESEYYTKY